MGSVYRFGEFALDGTRFELRRQGQVVKLERIPMELLLLLAEREGAVVSRQEIVERLWGKDVFVDTEHGINTAVRKIRQALRDNPEEPRFVRTVTGKGYRFVGEKSEQKNEEAAAESPAAVEVEKAAAVESAIPEVGAAGNPTGLSAKRSKWWVVAACVIAIAAAGFAFRGKILASERATQIHSIAVLPLSNLSGDASQDYFADGMTDEMITALAKIRRLRIVSRTSVMQFKGSKESLPEIARDLKVDGVLEGSLERTGNRVHMTVQLIYAPTDTHVWAESYDRDLNQIYSLPADVAQTVAKEVKATGGTPVVARYVNPEAHDAYLHGRYFWFTFDTDKTFPYFRKAIELQPDYAAAWSGLADTYALEGMDSRPPLEVRDLVHDAAAKALELDPSLPDAHNSMAAWYLFFAWDPVRADEECRRAIELDPNYPEAHHVRAYVLEALNRTAEAEVEEKRSVEIEPFKRPWELGGFFVSTRQYDAAIKEFQLQLAAHPEQSDVMFNLSNVYWLKGMYKESQESLEQALRMIHEFKKAEAAHRAWLKGGEKAVEQWGVDDARERARHQYITIFDMARTQAFTGDKDATMKLLERSYQAHDLNLIDIQYDPMFDFLHSDPRYQALVKKIGLTPAW